MSNRNFFFAGGARIFKMVDLTLYNIIATCMHKTCYAIGVYKAFVPVI